MNKLLLGLLIGLGLTASVAYAALPVFRSQQIGDNSSDDFILQTDGNSSHWVDPNDLGLSSPPGGSDGQIQFNSNNSFGGSKLLYSENFAGLPTITLPSGAIQDNGSDLIMAGNNSDDGHSYGATVSVGDAVAGIEGGNLQMDAGGWNINEFTDNLGARIDMGGGRPNGTMAYMSLTAGNTWLQMNYDKPGAIQLQPATSSHVEIDDASTSVAALFDTSLLSSSDKTFYFPDQTGALAVFQYGEGGFYLEPPQTLSADVPTSSVLTFAINNPSTGGSIDLWTAWNDDPGVNDGYGGVIAILPPQGIDSAHDGYFEIENPRSYNYARFNTDLLSGSQTFTFPDQSGTLVVTDGTSSDVVLSGNLLLPSYGTVQADDVLFLAANGNGASVYVQASPGTATSTAGGITYIFGGDGAPEGDGGNIYEQAGAAGSGNTNGGNVLLYAGKKSGSGTNGVVKVGLAGGWNGTLNFDSLTSHRVYNLPDVSGTMIVGTASSTGHATCWKAGGSIGYCSSVVSASGTCTCN